jgi:branched-chain amino acid transport system ATP-binding protein
MTVDVGTECLRIKGLRVRYAALEALHGIDLTLPASGVTLLLGPNGAGKTTLLNTIAGLLRPTDGTLEWADSRIDLAKMNVAERADAGIMLIPDGAGVFGRLTVAENLDLFAGRNGDRQPALDLFPELQDHLGQRAGTLSGGEQQMLALSRTALTPWRLLMIDELSHGLAAGLAARCYAAVAGIARPGDSRAVILAEPHPRSALDLADHVVVLRRGEVSFVGSRSEATAGTLTAAMT